MLTITKEHMNYDTAIELINKDRDISGICRVEFDDVSVEMPVRRMIIQLPLWEIYTKLNMPVTSHQYFLQEDKFNEKIYNSIMLQIYTEIFDVEKGTSHFNDLKDALWRCINHLDDFGTYELGEYVCGISIIDLAEIRLDPKVQEICNLQIGEEEGATKIKQELTKGEKELIAYLSQEEGVNNDALYPFLSTNTLKTSQLFQVMGHYGLRTEIDDRVIKRPVYGSALTGYMDFLDFGFENLSARKNVYYSLDAIRKIQYFNREMSLLCCILEHKYQGHCGNPVQLPFIFTETIIERCYGKYFYLPDDPDRTLKVLTKANAHKYVNRPVMMYSALTCGHVDGVCERCMGLLARNHTDGINIGITSSCNLISFISQLVLSTKHVDSAAPVLYQIPVPANEYFTIGKDGIRFRSVYSKMLDRFVIGIRIPYLHCTIGDLGQINIEMNVPEAKYSKIASIKLKDKETNIVEEFDLVTGGMTPFLTTEFLMYIKDHIKTHVEIDEEHVWVDLAAMKDKPLPFLRTIVYNNSTMLFVTHLEEMFKKGGNLNKYKHAGKALQDFAETIFSRVSDANIFQLEILLRAHMVTSPTNYSIPVVSDVEDVCFGKTKEVIGNRTISSQLAHEGHKKHFSMPTTFTTLKDQSSLDQFFNI